MFSNFEKAFKKDSSSFSDKIPEEIIKNLSRDLPENMTYVSVGNEGLFATSSDEKNTFNINFEIPEELQVQEVLNNPEKLHELLYRTQTSLQVKVDENGCILYNGTRMKMTELFRFPFDEDREIVDAVMNIVPQKFPKPFPLLLTGEDFEIKLDIKRVPHNSFSEIKLESQNKVIHLTYILDEEKRQFHASFRIDTDEVDRVEDMVKGFKLLKSLHEGKLSIAGMKIPQQNQNIDMINISYKFWKRAQDVQKILGVKFKPIIPLEKDDDLWIDILYRCLVEKRTVKSLCSSFTQSMVDYNLNDENNIEIGMKIALSFIGNSTVTIWDCSVNLWSLQVAYGCKIEDIAKSGNEITIKYGADEDEKIVLSSMYYLSEGEAKQVKNPIDEFQNPQFWDYYSN